MDTTEYSERDPNVVFHDEFAQFVNASKHPPNELSVPRCYTDPFQIGTPSINSSRSLPHSPFKRSQSIGYQTQEAPKYNSLRSLPSTSSCSPSSRPRLRRESAQDIDDIEMNPDINIELADEKTNNLLPVSNRRYLRLSASSVSQPFRSRSPIHQCSAPGTPMTQWVGKQSRTPSRSPSDESGHLQVPLSRTRGISLPDGMEDSIRKNNLYLLRQFNIRGSKVIHLGDSYQQREISSNSIHSYLSMR